MRRRDFIFFLSSAMVAAPLAARAQHPATPVIGLLSNSSRERGPASDSGPKPGDLGTTASLTAKT